MAALTRVVVAALGMLVMAVACLGNGEAPDGDIPQGGASGSEPVMVEATAPIESAVINIAESFPPQYFLAVTSGLPNGCVEFNGYEVTRDGAIVTVKVTNLQPEAGEPIACTTVYGRVETNIALGSDFDPGVTYTVLVNDKLTSFTAQGQPRPVRTEEPAPIERVALEYAPGASELVVVSGLPDGCHELAGSTLTRNGDTLEASITNTVELGVPCTERYRTVETRLSIDSAVEACRVYDVVANGEAYEVQAIGPAIRCSEPEPDRTPIPSGEVVPVEVPAPIDGVEVGMTRSIPPGVFLAVRSGLPNGCAEFGAYAVEVVQIDVTVTNIEPKDEGLICTDDYRTVDTRINLGSAFEPGKSYSVVVNGVAEATFDTPDGSPRQTGQDDTEVLEHPFQLKLGEATEVGSQGLSIEFVEVVEDSRCPSDVTCIWEGRAKVLIAVAVDGQDVGRHELALESGQPELAVASVGGYMIGIVTLDPYPKTTQDGEPDYEVTLAVSEGGGSADADSASIELSLRAEPVAGQPRTVRFVAELTGGPDNNRDLYCQGTEWQFGDGIGMATMPGCIEWTPSVEVPRRFEETYTYKSAGTYEASFSYGPVGPANVTVEVD